MKNHVIKALSITRLEKARLESLVEVPKEKERGDFAFPCFILASKLKKNPVQIAQDLVAKIKKNKNIEKVEAVGPYINFFLNQKEISKEGLQKIIKENENYGVSKIGKNKRFMIEFSQPNTHKAFHVGHIRGTAFGESIARIRESIGYKVIRANYSGDTGMHIAKWIWAYNKFHKKEKMGDESWFAKIYVHAIQKLEDNPDGQQQVEEINRKLDARDKELTKIWKETREASIKAWDQIYKDLDVEFDVHFFESEVEENGKEIAKELVKKKIAKISEEATIVDLKDWGLGVWVLLRKDGTVLYSAKDIALAEIKFDKYKMDDSLVITSVEQNLHFQQLKKTLELMHFPKWKQYNHLGYESVRFPWGKMSSRTGDNIFYSDFRDELVQEASKEIAKRGKVDKEEIQKRALAIAMAAMKYSMLKQDANKIIIFNKEEALRFEGDSGPYLLYSYARAQSILKKAALEKDFEITNVENEERLLLNALTRFPDVLDHASEHNSPAAIAHYSYDLAKLFNEFYHKSKVIGSEEEQFRLAIVKAFSIVLKNSLNLLGISVLDEM